MKKLSVALAGALALAGCSSPPPQPPPAIACAPGSVTGQGSSAQTNAVHAWIEDYQISCAAAAVEYGSVGSGAGVRAFAAGEGDFAGTDSPLTAADQRRVEARCGGAAVHLPLVAGPIAVAYNVAGAEVLNLSASTLARIFTGEVSAWNDAAVVAENPDIVLPATRIRPVYRRDDSGTTANFTTYLASSPEWSFGGVSAWPVTVGSGARGSHGVAAAIAATDGAIGYVEASYARVNDLPAAWVGDRANGFTAPTDYTIGRAIESARVADDLTLTPAPPAGAYPLVTITYEVVCRRGTPAVARSFLAYAASPAGQQAVAGAGYVPLPEALRARVAQAVAELG